MSVFDRLYRSRMLLWAVQDPAPGALCDQTPGTETVMTSASKWQPRDDSEPERPHTTDTGTVTDADNDDEPPLLLLARMRQHLAILRQTLIEVRADRTTLEEANGRLVAQRDTARQEAEALRVALAHLGGELEHARRMLAEAGPLRVADDYLLIQPPGKTE